MRLHKMLANAGMASRRQIETWIKDERIRVNGHIAILGQSIELSDRIEFDGNPVDLKHRLPEKPRVILYHKPEGEIASRSADGHKRVFDSLPVLSKGRWVMVGRLDVNTSGLLLFTNEGELAHRLMHPRFNLERHYAVRVLGKIDNAAIARLKQGVMLDGVRCRFKSIVPVHSHEGANQWFHVVLTEGRYREVRSLFASQGGKVSRLLRTQYGPIQLPRELKKGRWQELTGAKLNSLIQQDQRIHS